MGENKGNFYSDKNGTKRTLKRFFITVLIGWDPREFRNRHPSKQDPYHFAGFGSIMNFIFIISFQGKKSEF